MDIAQNFYIFSQYESDGSLYQCTAKTLKDIVRIVIVDNLEDEDYEVTLTDSTIEWDGRTEEYPDDAHDLACFLEDLREELGYPFEKIRIYEYTLESLIAQLEP